MKSQQEYMKNVRTIYLFSQFQLNFHSMSFTSDFRMLISQQSSTTPVRPAESINTKTEVFFMRELRNTKIIAVDHGYGNMKTANTVTPTGIKAYETEPIFTGNILEYNGIYYRIGEGHKEFIPDKAMDESDSSMVFVHTHHCIGRYSLLSHVQNHPGLPGMSNITISGMPCSRTPVCFHSLA